MSIQQSLTSKGVSTRDRILAAARKRLIDGGYEAFVMRELADSLEIKLGNLQYYFKTREQLIFGVFEQEADKDLVTIQKCQKMNAEADEIFQAVVKELVIRWRGHSGVILSTLLTLSMHNPSFKQLYRSIYLQFYDALKAPLCAMNTDLTEAEADQRVRLITALIDGSPMQVKVGNLDAFLERIKVEAMNIAMAP